MSWGFQVAANRNNHGASPWDSGCQGLAPWYFPLAATMGLPKLFDARACPLVLPVGRYEGVVLSMLSPWFETGLAWGSALLEYKQWHETKLGETAQGT